VLKLTPLPKKSKSNTIYVFVFIKLVTTSKKPPIPYATLSCVVKGGINDVTVSEKSPIHNFIIIVLLLTKLYVSKKWVPTLIILTSDRSRQQQI
jgi:hypothetical protein